MLLIIFRESAGKYGTRKRSTHVFKYPLHKLWLNTCDACHMAATYFAICCVPLQRQWEWKGGYKRPAAVQYCALSAKKLCRSAAGLPGLCNGWAWSVKPLPLSFIHVAQENLLRSWGATIGDTEKKADPMGGWGGAQEEGMYSRREWKIEARAWSDRKCSCS